MGHLTFDSNKKLHDLNTFYIEKPPAMENKIYCKCCEFICSEEDVLKKHVKKEHKTYKDTYLGESSNSKLKNIPQSLVVCLTPL